MGLANYILEALVREHCYKHINGPAVQIGRQTFELETLESIELCTRYGLCLDGFSESLLEVDCDTTQARQTGRSFISDRSFCKLLGIEKVQAVDHSDFEGADIIHDMNLPLPPSMESIAGLILDGSTLDNVHNPSIAIANYNRLLRPSGRIISINAGKLDIQGAYTGMSAEWFLDYYAFNHYEDCQIYMQLNFNDGPLAFIKLDYNWIAENARMPELKHDGWAFVIVVAEKGEHSSFDRLPIRASMRNVSEHVDWLSAINRYAASSRIFHFHNEREGFVVPEGFLSSKFG